LTTGIVFDQVFIRGRFVGGCSDTLRLVESGAVLALLSAEHDGAAQFDN
jgi:hypothetical protein